jgi:hypothetical protein
MTGSSHNRRRLASVDARILVALLVAAPLACGRDSPPGSPAGDPVGVGSGSAYAADMENLCNVVERSGAGSAHPNDRAYLVATWLGTRLTTQDARKFLAQIQPLDGDAKATALETEAKRAGLAGCPLAAEWRKPKAP